MITQPVKAGVCSRCGGPGNENLTPSGTLVCNQCIRIVLTEPVNFDEPSKPVPLHEKTTALAGVLVGALLLVGCVVAAATRAADGAARMEIKLIGIVGGIGLVALIASIRKLRER